MEEIRAPKNFIEEFIEEDIKEKGLTHIQTRFPPEPSRPDLSHHTSFCRGAKVANQLRVDGG